MSLTALQKIVARLLASHLAWRGAASDCRAFRHDVVGLVILVRICDGVVRIQDLKATFFVQLNCWLVGCVNVKKEAVRTTWPTLREQHRFCNKVIHDAASMAAPQELRMHAQHWDVAMPLSFGQLNIVLAQVQGRESDNSAS